MNMIFRRIILGVFLVAITIFAANLAPVFAHGGEDHGEAKAQTSVKQNVETRTAVIGDLEILIKTPLLEPDKEIVGKLFLTSHETNEPVGDAKITLSVEGEDGKKTEIAAAATENKGVYTLKILPIPQGSVKLGVKINHSGKDEIVSFGTAEIKPALIESSAENTDTARSLLTVAGIIFGLLLLGFLAFLIFRNFRPGAQKIETETVSA